MLLKRKMIKVCLSESGAKLNKTKAKSIQQFITLSSSFCNIVCYMTELFYRSTNCWSAHMLIWERSGNSSRIWVNLTPSSALIQSQFPAVNPLCWALAHNLCLFFPHSSHITFRACKFIHHSACKKRTFALNSHGKKVGFWGQRQLLYRTWARKKMLRNRLKKFLPSLRFSKVIVNACSSSLWRWDIVQSCGDTFLRYIRRSHSKWNASGQSYISPLLPIEFTNNS